MTSPISKPKKAKPVPAAAAETRQRRDWCCGTAITDPHTTGCAYAPHDADVVEPTESTPEPPPTPHEVPVAAQRVYGFSRPQEDDLELPSGGLVRYRKLNKGLLLKLNLVEVMDGFTPELINDIRSEDTATAEQAALRALVDPERNNKIFGPIDRVVAAAVVTPQVVLTPPASRDQVHIDDVDLEDKVAIFMAAIGEQLDALKSVRSEPAARL